MLGWSYHLHLDCFLLTANNTDATAEALIRADNCLVFLAPLRAHHLYRIEQATVDTNLAATAIIQIDGGLVATLLPDLTDVLTGLVYWDVQHAAVTATLAAEPGAGYGRVILPFVEQPGLFTDIIQLQGLLQAYFFT